MKVALVYPDIIPGIGFYEGHYSQAVGLLAALMKRENHHVSLIHITRDITEEEFCEQVRKENPDLLAFTSTSNQFSLVNRLISYLERHNFGMLTICGGPHVTLNPHEVMNNSGIDIICIGEGDEALVNLCSKLEKDEDYSGINNLWVRWKGEVIKNPLSPYIDVNQLPAPDRKIFLNYQKLMWERLGRAAVMASRGCPYNCSYCCNHALREVQGKRNYTRFRSVNLLIDELKCIMADFSFINSFHFDDDILTLDKKWFYEFSSIYSRDIGRPYSCNIRPNLITEESVNMLSESGCDMVQMGIESGNESIRNKVLNRGLREETIAKAFELCRAAGIKVHTLNMVGVPFESPLAVLDTVKMNSRFGANSSEIFIFYPYKGTTLYDICKKENYLTGRDNVDYFTDSILSLPGLNREQIIMFRNYFKLFVYLYRAVYKLKGRVGIYIVRFIDKILALKITASILVAVYPLLRWLWLNVVKRSYKSFNHPIKIKFTDE